MNAHSMDCPLAQARVPSTHCAGPCTDEEGGEESKGIDCRYYSTDACRVSLSSNGGLTWCGLLACTWCRSRPPPASRPHAPAPGGSHLVGAAASHAAHSALMEEGGARKAMPGAPRGGGAGGRAAGRCAAGAAVAPARRSHAAHLYPPLRYRCWRP